MSSTTNSEPSDWLDSVRQILMDLKNGVQPTASQPTDSRIASVQKVTVRSNPARESKAINQRRAFDRIVREVNGVEGEDHYFVTFYNDTRFSLHMVFMAAYRRTSSGDTGVGADFAYEIKPGEAFNFDLGDCSTLAVSGAYVTVSGSVDLGGDLVPFGPQNLVPRPGGDTCTGMLDGTDLFPYSST